MPRFLAALWAYGLSWISSALIHVVDADVGSIRGLGEPAVLVSVSIVALIMSGPVLCCRLAFRRGRWPGFFRAVTAFAAGMGLLIVTCGFGGRSAAAWVVALLGMSALFGLMIVAAALPTLWFDRSRNLTCGFERDH